MNNLFLQIYIYLGNNQHYSIIYEAVLGSTLVSCWFFLSRETNLWADVFEDKTSPNQF